ncbi:hypothetical protein D3C72_1977640 [compost metagenome]
MFTSKLFNGFAFGTNNEIIIVSKFSNSFLIAKISEVSKLSKANSGEGNFAFKVLKNIFSVFLYKLNLASLLFFCASKASSALELSIILVMAF